MAQANQAYQSPIESTKRRGELWPELQASPNHNDLSEHIAMATPSLSPSGPAYRC